MPPMLPGQRQATPRHAKPRSYMSAEIHSLSQLMFLSWHTLKCSMKAQVTHHLRWAGERWILLARHGRSASARWDPPLRASLAGGAGHYTVHNGVLGNLKRFIIFNLPKVHCVPCSVPRNWYHRTTSRFKDISKKTLLPSAKGST